MVRGRPWTPEEDALLIQNVKIGKTHAEIGNILRRTRNAVNLRASFLGATMAPDAALRNRAHGRALFYSDADRVAARSQKYSRCCTRERRQEMAEKMRGNKRAVGSWNGKRYPDTAKRLISAIRSGQHAKAIGLPRDHPLRGLYHQLMRKVGASEARRIIREEIKRLPAIEQQIIRVQLGASIAHKIAAPEKQYDFTLGGVA